MKKLESALTRTLMLERKMYAAQEDGKRFKFKWYKYKYNKANKKVLKLLEKDMIKNIS